MIALKYLNPSQKEGRYDAFMAGLLGGYVVFGRSHGNVSQQVCFVFPRKISTNSFLLKLKLKLKLLRSESAWNRRLDAETRALFLHAPLANQF
jgi:peroxisomal membrane protein 4